TGPGSAEGSTGSGHRLAPACASIRQRLPPLCVLPTIGWCVPRMGPEPGKNGQVGLYEHACASSGVEHRSGHWEPQQRIRGLNHRCPAVRRYVPSLQETKGKLTPYFKIL